jgi:hypothetical protein
MTALPAKFCTGTPTGIRFTTKRDSIPVCLKHWIISAAMTAGTVKKRGFQPLHLHKRQQKGSFIPQKLPKIKYHLFHEPMLPAANMIRTALRPG